MCENLMECLPLGSSFLSQVRTGTGNILYSDRIVWMMRCEAVEDGMGLGHRPIRLVALVHVCVYMNLVGELR